MAKKPPPTSFTVTTNPYAKKETAVKSFIVLLALALFLSLWPSGSMANHPPPPVPDGLIIQASLDCTDGESNEKGLCIYFVDGSGQAWLGFYQNDAIAMIRKLASDGSYETTWRSDTFNTY